MDSELDRTYNPFGKPSPEFEAYLDEWYRGLHSTSDLRNYVMSAQQSDPEEKTDARLDNRPEF